MRRPSRGRMPDLNRPFTPAGPVSRLEVRDADVPSSARAAGVNQSHPGGSVFVCGSQSAHGSSSSSLLMFGNMNSPVSKPGQAGSVPGSDGRLAAVRPDVAAPAVRLHGLGVDAARQVRIAVLALLLVPPEVDAVRVARALARVRSPAHSGSPGGSPCSCRRRRCCWTCRRPSPGPARHGSSPAPSAASCRGASCRRCSSPRRCCRCRRRSGSRCRPAPGTSGHTTVGSRSSTGCLQ